MKNKSSLLSPLLALCLLAPAAAQQQPPPTTQRPQPSRPTTATTTTQPQQTAGPDDDDIVRITSNLVQLDVIVTDKNGRPVTDLRPEDFQIFEDGKEREITNFSFVSTEALAPGQPAEAGAAAQPAPRRTEKGLPVVPSAPLRRRQVKRTIAFVVDNLRMSHMSAASAREGLRKFVDEQMQPGDLVGIHTTRGGSGALQQFTSDKAQLHKAIDRVRWYPPPLGGGGVDVFEPARDDSTFKPVRPGSGDSPRGADTFEDAASRERRERNDERNRDLVAYGALGTLRYIIRGMQEAPGRKSVVLFSDGLPLFSREDGTATRSFDAMDRVIESANRASVVIYTVDARGVFVSGMITAADDVRAGGTQALTNARLEKGTRAEDGLAYLPSQTGGLFIRGHNYMDRALERVMRDQGGFYLLGYRPSEQTFKGGSKGFREIDVKVRRPDVNVRSRRGFTAVTDEETRRETRGSDKELYALLASPVNAGGVYVRLTAQVVGDPRGGSSAARMLLHVDGKDLTFTDAPEGGGYKKLVLDVAAVTLGKEGQIVDEFNRTHTVRTGGDHLDNIVRHGLTYTADVPVKKPGTYQLRIVVRDQASQRVGSASQLIDVPDMTKQRLTLSGLTLREIVAGAQQQPPTQSARPTAETAIAAVTSPSDPAVRRFRPGAILAYGTQVYHTSPGGAPGAAPRLTAQVSLFQNGQQVMTSPPAAVEFDPARPGWLEGAMRLVPQAKPGEYILQVVVTDESVKDKDRRQTAQWIDFEVIN